MLPGVTVTLTGKQGSKTQVTDASGVYRFPALEVGTYEIVAELSGFAEGHAARDRRSPRAASSTIDLQMKVGGRRGEHHRHRRVAGRRRQEQRDRDDDLAVAALQRADHPHRDQRAQLRAGRQQQLGVRRRRRLGQRAAHRRRRHARSERRHRLDVLQLQHRRGIPVPGARRAGGIRRLHRRGGQHHHQVGRQPVLRACSTSSGPTASLGGNNVSDEIAAANPTLADPAVTKKYADITTQFGGPIKQNKLFFFVSAQRFLLETDPTGGVTKRHEVSPRLNFKLTWQPNANNNFTGHLQYDAYNIIGRAGVSALIANDDLTNQEDAPEYVWMTQYRHLFNSNTFLEVEVHRLVGVLRSQPEDARCPRTSTRTGLVHDSQGWFYYADRTRDQANASDHPLRRQVRPSRAEVRRRVRAQHDPRSLRLQQRLHLLRLRRRALLRLQLRLRPLGQQHAAVALRAGCLARHATA